MNTTEHVEQLMNAGEVRSLARIGYVTLWRWVKDGKFPEPIPEWPGRARVWKREDVLKALGLNK